MTRIAHIIILFALLNGCASTKGVRADLTKIRPWSAELERAEPLPAPYVVDFEAGTRSLTYIAVEHSNEASSPSLKLIGNAMASRRFSAVVLEGFPRSKGLSPESLRLGSEKDGANGFYRDGETSVAVKLAVLKKVPFVGGEPDEDIVKAAIFAAGYSLEDLFCFYMTRMIPSWRRDGTLTRQSFEESYAELAPSMGKRLGLQAPSLEFYRKWYQAKMNKPFHARDVKDENLAPLPEGSVFTQRISAVIGRIRNEHIVRVTEEMLNLYSRVLVVYGSSHYPMQQLALESMLGKPARISDQP